MAVSMISLNSVSFSNYDSGSGGGSSGLLDFSSGNSGDSSAMQASALPVDQSSMAPLEAGMMNSTPMAPSDSFQSSAPMADYSPPPQAAPGPGGGFDFVA
ncbi:hypothetical protein JST97_14875 [bacterium]|nr:hypothetical protein [bacterium]